MVFSRFKIREILEGHGVSSDNLFWQTARGWTEIHLLADPAKEEGSPWATALCCSCLPYHQPVTWFPVLQQHPELNLNHGIQNKRAAHSRYICPSHIFLPFYSITNYFCKSKFTSQEQYKKFPMSPVFTFAFGTFPPSHPAYNMLTFSKNSSKNHSFCLLLEADSAEAIHMFWHMQSLCQSMWKKLKMVFEQ